MSVENKNSVRNPECRRCQERRDARGKRKVKREERNVKPGKDQAS
jgi:hypothetical protein